MPTETKNHYKVNVHSKNYANADLVINRKDFADIQLNDIVEIYHPEDEFSRLLLQVTVFKEDLQGKDVVSVEQGVASTFQLRAYSDVVVHKVDSNSVILDSLEVTFKDQYLGRSEMWRLKNNLVNTCVYLNKKIEFCNGTARVQVCEMWSQGERVACGVISEETKIVFRSSTSMVYLFVQMSSEMWEFDIHGDLYFEKAVNGFLADLFHKWKKHGSNHEVTIVLFSRVFYKANSIDEFPDHMRECLQKDYKNQFYEDFYRVAIQNEKYDDWGCKLVEFQSLFVEYRKNVLEHHKKPGCRVPQAYLSTAAHGNFLEVLNISLNVFEKHYLERSLDRTGQLSVVISPGVGVFEVDRELTNVTKQRIIDNGVGCDLVCIGEQPLHAVPLLKFHNKDTTIMRDDYSMPHWMNLSFYSGDKKLAYSKFIPRIRLPSRRTKSSNSCNHLSAANSKSKLPTTIVEETSLLGCSVSPADVDYDEYDEQVFTLPSSHIACVQKLFSRTRKLSYSQDTKLMKFKLSDPDIYRSHLSSHASSSTARSKSIAISEAARATSGLPRSSFSVVECDRLQSQESSEDDGNAVNTAVGSLGSSNSSASGIGHKNQFQNTCAQNAGNSVFGPGRALINPFDPSHVTVKVTSNRRRWTHVFPKGPAGVIIQQHHYQPELPQDSDFYGKFRRTSDHDLNSGTEDDFLVAGLSPTSDCRLRSKTCMFVGSPTSGAFLSSRKAQTLLWGATGEQKWTPTLTTGVDWKSLVIPACLPITTDFFPDEVSLNNDYLFSDYNLLPDDVNADYARKRAIYRDPLRTFQVFIELISERLAQGFQLIVDSDTISCTPAKYLSTAVPKGISSDRPMEYKLSIGRIFHKISLCKSEIRITRYRPKHPYPPFIIQYRYRFRAPDHITYGISWASFNAEKLENFNWNYLDHYICTRGDTDFSLIESCKFWRFRLYALPTLQPGTKKIMDGSPCCDVYTRSSYEEKQSAMEGFLKFTESAINKIRRMTIQKPASKLGGNAGNNSPYRERLGSINRAVRPRSVSKMVEKHRVSPIADIPPLTMSFDSDNCDVFESSPESPKIKENMSNVELVEMMSHPQDGIGFLSKSPSLPSNTFISYDAVQWLKKHIEGIFDESDAIQQLEELRKEKLICHASGDFSHPLMCGFYLYYIPRKEEKPAKERSDYTEPIYDLVTFKNEWAEIETVLLAKEQPFPIFLRNDLPSAEMVNVSKKQSVPAYKEAYLEVDMNGKSDRIEWGHFRYQSEYSVEQAYELIIEWMAASGPIVSDLIYSLARKAQTYNLQLIPVPADPHALPYAMKSDPLRGPIFVPLDVSCLSDSDGSFFEEYEPETRLQRLLLLQEEIAIRFGFISCKGGADAYHHHNQYVHLTGNVFLLITSPLNGYWMDQDYFTLLRNKSTPPASNSNTSSANCESIISPHQEYVRRHITQYHDDKYKTDQRVGYLWSWNHMIGRRWKGTNAAINDEAFQDKLLGDFRKLCSNDANRLRCLWNKCYAMKPSSTPSN